MDAKVALAREIVARFHGAPAARRLRTVFAAVSPEGVPGRRAAGRARRGREGVGSRDGGLPRLRELHLEIRRAALIGRGSGSERERGAIRPFFSRFQRRSG